jgi:nucleotide-binding universal stress UspA family protein
MARAAGRTNVPPERNAGMYERIVVGTDGSSGAEQAVRAAADMAALTGASLHLVVGCGSSTLVLGAEAMAATMANTAAEIATAWEENLEERAGPLRSEGLQVDVHAVPESGADAVVDVAKAVGADLIVVGNRGMSGARRVLGSVPNTVSHRAPCSVLIVSTT